MKENINNKKFYLGIDSKLILKTTINNECK